MATLPCERCGNDERHERVPADEFCYYDVQGSMNCRDGSQREQGGHEQGRGKSEPVSRNAV